MRATGLLVLWMAAGPVLAQDRPDDPVRVNRYLAADTLVHVATSDGRRYFDRLADSSLGTLFDEPEVRQFMDELAGGIARELDAFADRFGLRLGDLPALLEGEITVNLTGLEVGAPDPFVDRLLVTMAVGRQEALYRHLLGRLLEAARAENPEATSGEEDVAGATVEWLTIGQRTLSWTFHRGVLFAATDRAALDALLGRIGRGRTGGLVESPRYLGVARRTASGRPALWAYVDVARIRKRFDDAMKGEQKRALATLALDQVEAVGLASTIAAGGAVDRLYIHAPGATGGVWDVLDGQPAYRGEGLELVPAGAFLVEAGTYDLAAFAEGSIDLARRLVGREEYADEDRRLDEFREFAGADLTEFLEGVGGQTVLYAALPEVGGLMPDVVLLARLDPASPFPARLERFLDRATAAGADEPALDLREIPFGERTFRYVNLSRSGQQQIIAPAFAIEGDLLVVSQTPQSLKRALLRLDRRDGTPDIRSAADFARTTSLLAPGYGSLGYVDLRRGVVSAYNSFVPFFQAVAFKGDVPFEPGLLPTGEVLARHLFGAAWATYRTADGFAIELATPVGLAPLLGAAAVLGAIDDSSKGAAALAAGQGPRPMPEVALDYRGVTVAFALDDLARRSGVAIHFRRDDCQSRVEARADDLPVADAVGRVLEGTGLSYRHRLLPGGEHQIVVYR